MSIGSAVFAQLTVDSPDILQWAATLPLPPKNKTKLPLFFLGSGTPSNTWFPIAHQSRHHLDGISIGSAVFAGLMNVTNRHTGRQTTLLRV